MLGWVGVRLGANWEKIRPYLHIADYVVVAVLVVFILWVIVKWRKSDRAGRTASGMREA